MRKNYLRTQVIAGKAFVDTAELDVLIYCLAREVKVICMLGTDFSRVLVCGRIGEDKITFSVSEANWPQGGVARKKTSQITAFKGRRGRSPAPKRSRPVFTRLSKRELIDFFFRHSSFKSITERCQIEAALFRWFHAHGFYTESPLAALKQLVVEKNVDEASEFASGYLQNLTTDSVQKAWEILHVCEALLFSPDSPKYMEIAIGALQCLNEATCKVQEQKQFARILELDQYMERLAKNVDKKRFVHRFNPNSLAEIL